MAPISKATAYNWRKLNSNTNDKLGKRANKTQSAKRIVAGGYVCNAIANKLLATVAEIGAPIESIMYSLAVSMLEGKHIVHKPHVAKFIQCYSHIPRIEVDIPEGVWQIDADVLGFIYQSLLPEGERNMGGQYYTSRQVAQYMLGNTVLDANKTFLDPCCGSGAFLLCVHATNPENLYGFDINPIAVMLASANLLAKYANTVFTPNVYCIDFLKPDPFNPLAITLPQRFNYIYTNPPWGSDKAAHYATNYPQVKSKERASMFIVEALKHLHRSGELYFLLPTSLLKIRTHADIRRLLLHTTTIQQIDLYDNRFDGVFTDFFSIKLSPSSTAEQHYRVCRADCHTEITLPQIDYCHARIITDKPNHIAEGIISKMEALRHDDLTHSQWALGIVTGDNKNKVKKNPEPGLEPIYTGKQVSPFALKEENLSYIHFAPETFQQCAPTKYYRAAEKLIYRFIAKYPIVAYDDKQRLCLNSANILIPDVDGLTAKSIAALLNSSLYRFYYTSKFTDIKVLKSNLQSLPFPKLTIEQEQVLSQHSNTFLAHGFATKQQQLLDKTVYSIFGISNPEQDYIGAQSM